MHGTTTTKVPSIPQNFPSFPFEMMPLPSTSITTPSDQTSWVDEFLDFSAARRSSHRRPACDAITFVEAPYIEECHNSNGTLMSCDNNGFETGLDDDEKVLSMFSDDVAPTPGGSTKSRSKLSSTNPSTPPDQNSENNERTPPHDPQQAHVQPKNEPGDDEDSSGKPQMHLQMENPTKTSTETIVDPKRIKRILANRQSAQRSRVRKLQYVSELERSVTTLQNEVSALSPRVAFLDHQRLLLNVDNSALKQRIAALAQDNIFKDAHQEALKKEIERLRQIYHEQNLKKMANEASNEAPTPPPPLPTCNKIGFSDEE